MNVPPLRNSARSILRCELRNQNTETPLNAVSRKSYDEPHSSPRVRHLVVILIQMFVSRKCVCC